MNILLIKSFKKKSTVAVLASLVVAQSVHAATPTTVTILPVPAPVQTSVVGEIGQVQGMITAVGGGFVIIDNATVTHDGDTVITYNGGITALAVGEMVNYTYIVDVDGVIIAKTMDAYPAEAVSGTDRVSSISVTNSTGVVSLPLYKGGAVDFYQNSGIYVVGAGTNTAYG
jgi:predicted small secreted protein